MSTVSKPIANIGLFLALLFSLSSYAYADVTSEGVPNFDGSVTYTTPQVSVNGSMTYIAGYESDSGNAAKGFCAVKGQSYVNSSDGVNAGPDSLAELSESGQLVLVSPDIYYFLSSLICR
jgi:hypothetical protein